MTDTFSSLNIKQQEAVCSEGPTCVVAGPGTGKTHVIVMRVWYLVSKLKVDPREILILTFTRKAATELQERLFTIVNKKITAKTFHSLCFDILSAEHQTPHIIDDQERDRIIRLIRRNRGIKQSVRDLTLRIAHNKHNNQQDEIVEVYQSELAKRGLVDYEDVLLHTKKLLSQKRNAHLFPYIFIDEFQDTNTTQYTLVKQLLQKDNLFAIGDPNQSIYAFRGSNSAIFSQIAEDFPNTNTITLDINYRSQKHIIDVGSCLFPSAPKQAPFSEQNDGETVLLQTENEFSEAHWVVEKIEQLVGGTDLLQAGDNAYKEHSTTFRDIAIVCRTHYLNKYIEKELSAKGIPYQKIGAQSWYNNPRMVLVFAMLRYIQRPSYQELFTLISVAGTGLSQKARNILTNNYVENPETFRLLSSQLPKQDQVRIQTIEIKLNALRDKGQPLTLSQLIGTCWEMTGEGQTEEEQLYLSLVCHIALQFEKNKQPLQAFLAHLDSLADHDYYDSTIDAVSVLTMHASKGLEFKHVFITGFEEGVIPLKRAGEIEDANEEKRLLYVAITRAKEDLYFTYTKQRNKIKRSVSPFWALLKKSGCAQEMIDPKIAVMEKKRVK
ncbi:ATP-dependent helicase [Candidatus Woesebacteria bacterium]|nr:ATP-dependent helicase [Candidatus Woesebacteria bacterium]